MGIRTAVRGTVLVCRRADHAQRVVHAESSAVALALSNATSTASGASTSVTSRRFQALVPATRRSATRTTPAPGSTSRRWRSCSSSSLASPRHAEAIRQVDTFRHLAGIRQWAGDQQPGARIRHGARPGDPPASRLIVRRRVRPPTDTHCGATRLAHSEMTAELEAVHAGLCRRSRSRSSSALPCMGLRCLPVERSFRRRVLEARFTGVGLDRVGQVPMRAPPALLEQEAPSNVSGWSSAPALPA